jgi:hypothetical protein
MRRIALALLIAVPLLRCPGKAVGVGSDGGPSTDAGADAGALDAGRADAGGADAGSSDGGGLLKGSPMGKLLGVNGFISEPPSELTPLGTIREYHNWGWIADNYASGPAYPGMLYTFMNFNGWDWDVFFADIKDAGAEAFPAVQGSVPWMNNSAIPPIPAGADKLAAASYVAHGDAMFQIAARYGSTQVADAKLKLQPNQTRVSGLATVAYFENFNEQDNAAGFTGDAFAAMSSADYDGDQVRLGNTIGIKNADPNAKLVMGGLSGSYPTATKWVPSITTFLDAMRTWSQANRGGSFPADVINVHLYSFGPGGTQPAVSPEDDGVFDKLSSVVAYRDQYLPGKELWWTEFGYDTDPGSILHAPALGANSAPIVQGQWLVRDFLIAAALGFDRATLFVSRDNCIVGSPGCNSTQQFATCGVMDANGVPKPSWYFLATVRSRLSSMVYVGTQPPPAGKAVRIYQFKDTQGPGGALVVWSPTSNATTVSAVPLALPAGATTAQAVTLADQQQNGIASNLTVSAGSVMLDVTETPTLLLVDAMP